MEIGYGKVYSRGNSTPSPSGTLHTPPRPHGHPFFHTMLVSFSDAGGIYSLLTTRFTHLSSRINIPLSTPRLGRAMMSAECATFVSFYGTLHHRPRPHCQPS